MFKEESYDSMLQYLLDTDMCIYLLNGDECVKSRIAQVGIETISVSILTVGELYFGAYNSKRLETNLERISEFLSSPGPIVLSFDDAAAKYFESSKPRYAVMESLSVI